MQIFAAGNSLKFMHIAFLKCSRIIYMDRYLTKYINVFSFYFKSVEYEIYEMIIGRHLTYDD